MSVVNGADLSDSTATPDEQPRIDATTTQQERRALTHKLAPVPTKSAPYTCAPTNDIHYHIPDPHHHDTPERQAVSTDLLKHRPPLPRSSRPSHCHPRDPEQQYLAGPAPPCQIWLKSRPPARVCRPLEERSAAPRSALDQAARSGDPTAPASAREPPHDPQIGRASCRERVSR